MCGECYDNTRRHANKCPFCRAGGAGSGFVPVNDEETSLMPAGPTMNLNMYHHGTPDRVFNGLYRISGAPTHSSVVTGRNGTRSRFRNDRVFVTRVISSETITEYFCFCCNRPGADVLLPDEQSPVQPPRGYRFCSTGCLENYLLNWPYNLAVWGYTAHTQLMRDYIERGFCHQCMTAYNSIYIENGLCPLCFHISMVPAHTLGCRMCGAPGQPPHADDPGYLCDQCDRISILWYDRMTRKTRLQVARNFFNLLDSFWRQVGRLVIADNEENLRIIVLAWRRMKGVNVGGVTPEVQRQWSRDNLMMFLETDNHCFECGAKLPWFFCPQNDNDTHEFVRPTQYAKCPLCAAAHINGDPWWGAVTYAIERNQNMLDRLCERATELALDLAEANIKRAVLQLHLCRDCAQPCRGAEVCNFCRTKRRCTSCNQQKSNHQMTTSQVGQHDICVECTQDATTRVKCGGCDWHVNRYSLKQVSVSFPRFDGDLQLRCARCVAHWEALFKGINGWLQCELTQNTLRPSWFRESIRHFGCNDQTLAETWVEAAVANYEPLPRGQRQLFVEQFKDFKRCISCFEEVSQGFPLQPAFDPLVGFIDPWIGSDWRVCEKCRKTVRHYTCSDCRLAGGQTVLFQPWEGGKRDDKAFTLTCYKHLRPLDAETRLPEVGRCDWCMDLTHKLIACPGATWCCLACWEKPLTWKLEVGVQNKVAREMAQAEARAAVEQAQAQAAIERAEAALDAQEEAVREREIERDREARARDMHTSDAALERVGQRITRSMLRHSTPGPHGLRGSLAGPALHLPVFPPPPARQSPEPPAREESPSLLAEGEDLSEDDMSGSSMGHESPGGSLRRGWGITPIRCRRCGVWSVWGSDVFCPLCDRS